MFKKLLTLAAVAAVGFGFAQAEVETVAFKDYTTEPWDGYIMGYIPGYASEDGMLFEWPHFDYKKVADNAELKDKGYEVVTLSDGDYYIVPCENDGYRDEWGIQANMLMGFTGEVGEVYTVVICAKTDREAGLDATVCLNWGWGGGQGFGMPAHVTTEWTEIECTTGEVGGTGIFTVLQIGAGTSEENPIGQRDGKLWVRWAKVLHDKGEQAKPTEWIDCLVNGDAEGEYGEIPCAYSKEYIGRGAAPEYKELAEPQPAAIETVDGSKVFVVHAKAVNPDDCPEFFYNEDGTVKGDPAWQNQFWIQSPKQWAAGDMFRVSFRYKAAKAASADTQAHRRNAGDYLHWDLLGGVNFTTEWQNFEKTVTVSNEQDGMWSAAFNLKEYQSDNTYYFDDLKWETMKLDEGWFIAGDFNDNNLSEAIEMECVDEEDEIYEATIGTDAKPAQVIKISSVRGDNQAFNANTISIGSAEVLDGEPIEYGLKSAAKINLPEAAVWDVEIDTGTGIGYVTFSLNDGGVANVDAEFVAPVYYNLQGVKVANPAQGQIYIVKRGAKVSKQIIR